MKGRSMTGAVNKCCITIIMPGVRNTGTKYSKGLGGTRRGKLEEVSPAPGLASSARKRIIHRGEDGRDDRDSLDGEDGEDGENGEWAIPPASKKPLASAHTYYSNMRPRQWMEFFSVA